MAEAFAILRTKKLKTQGNVAGSASHIERTRPTANARPGVENEWLQGGPGMYAKAKDIWDSVPKKRSDAVHGIEVLMTASPEAFANGLDLDLWKAQSIDWLRKQFNGAEIVGACLHLDESTPHIQAIIVPTCRKPDGTLQLNCKKFLGGAAKLSAMQTSYAKAVQNLGLERGLQGSKAKHTRVEQFYRNINRQTVKLVAPVVSVPPLFLSEKGRAAWSDAQTKSIVRGLSAPISQIKDQARAGITYKRQATQLKKSNSALSADLADAKRREKEAAAQLRSLPLEQVAQALGCYQSKKLLEKDPKMWESPAGKIRIEGSKFFNHEEGKGGGGAFDLVMHINSCSYSEALAFLRDEFDPAAAVQAAAEAARLQALAQVKKAAPAPFSPPQRVEQNWPRVRHYLTEIRALAGSLIDKLKADGWIGADFRKNAFFLKADGNRITSAELRGTGQSQFKGSRGKSSEGVFPVIVEGSTKLAVCESAIDAISYVQTHDGFSAIATGGTGKFAAAQKYIEKHRDKYNAIVCASDNGEGGAGMARALSLPHDPPPGSFCDWNDFAKAAGGNPRLFKLIEEKPEPELAQKPKAQPRKHDAQGPSLG